MRLCCGGRRRQRTSEGGNRLWAYGWGTDELQQWVDCRSGGHGSSRTLEDARSKCLLRG